jgi:serine/threonine protein kinase/tetratricopeptide (TPR) repeat protein
MNPGDRLAHYEIVSSLGAGGMGEVYRAKDLRLGRDVALKRASPALANTIDAARRFEQEARALAALSHPHVATVYGLEEFDGNLFLVMELVDGEPLDRRLTRGPISVADALKWGAQIADGLDAAHQQGIIHRDLKPSNVVVSRQGQVKLLDFGLSKLLVGGDEGTTRLVTAEGEVLGTAPYMSPEQISGKPVDVRTDVWSFGCVLYEMLTGVRAFPADSFATAAAAILAGRPDLQRLPSEVPAAVRELIEACLQKNPDERPRSLANVRLTLTPGDRQSSSRTHRHTWKVIAGALAVLGAITVWLFTRADSTARHGRRPEVEAIAVLPLVNDSPDRTQGYFVDGMTDALINDLSQLGLWTVISRTSVMRYRSDTRRLPEIARELRVDAVVEGSVLQAGNRVRIAARLLDAATEQPLWAGTYERELAEILSLQRDVARAIATELKGTLTVDVNQRLGRGREVDPEAHLLYMKGRHLWNERTPATLQEAIRHFERVLATDPTNALALSGLAESYVLLPGPGTGSWRPADAFPRALEYSARAIDLDPTLAGAHAARAYAALLWEWDWATAEREFQQAIRLNPSYANAYFWFAAGLASRGRMDEAITNARKAVVLDPVSPIITAGLAWMQHFARQYDAAIATVRPILDLNPRFVMLHNRLAIAYRQKGLAREATGHHEQAVTASGRNADMVAELAASLAAAGQRREAQTLVDELEARGRTEYVPAYANAVARLAVGEPARALDWLERAVDERSWYLPFIAVEPDMDPLRADPRFQKVLRTTRLDGVQRSR